MVKLGGLQKIGRALMLPIAVMPAAALLLRLGADDIVAQLHIASLPPAARDPLLTVFSVMTKSGGAIFDNLPMLFAIGVAIGLADGAGVAALAALVGYLVLMAVFTSMTGFLIQIHLLGAADKINMGVFAGILVGVTAAYLYRRFKDTKLPDYLQFFGGRRFVPIVTAFTILLMGLVLGFVWPPIQRAIGVGGNWMVANGTIGVFIYGTLNRLLLPFGLHHILNTLVWFDIGTFKDAAGAIVKGDLHRFFAGDKSAGIFMAGFYPVMMFGLPAACIAMVRAARPDRRKIIAGVLMSAALTSFLTGVTEPIEFAFMFLAPVLYLVHALLTGASLVIANLIGAKHGFGFSAGLIDYVLSYGIATKPYLLLLVGAGYAALYYVLFSVIIVKFNLPTPGREPEETVDEKGQAAGGGAISDRARAICEALGGRGNLAVLDSCITRLRLKLLDEALVDDRALKALGAHGVVRLGGGGIQVVVGTQAELICEQMKLVKPSARVLSPFTGRVLRIEDVPDEVFSQKMMGDGSAVEPTAGVAVAPVSGELVAMFPTGHAFGIRTPDGLEVLVHVGLNTVDMKGEGFKALKKQGDRVRAGETVVTFDLELCRAKAKSLVSPIVITNMERAGSLRIAGAASATAGKDVLFEVDIKPD
jgi:N-acetylglucosamine PTS system EIICBA or EIICB component